MEQVTRWLEILDKKFTRSTLRDAVNFLSNTSTINDYREYLEKYKVFHPSYKEILKVLLTLDSNEVAALLKLSSYIAQGYEKEINILDVIPNKEN